MKALERVCTLSPSVMSVVGQVPLSMGFFQEKYWSGLPFPSPKDLPDPGIEPMSPVSPALEVDFFFVKPL